jgi:D-alanyl-D-alanine carboxypeptidase
MRRALVQFAAAAVLGLGLNGVGSAPVLATPPSAPTSPDGDLGAAVADFIGDNPGGVVMLVVEDGVATTATAGSANASGDPMTPDTVFRIGSLSKPFVAAMVMQLVDEGAVDLDAPLSTYLPATLVGGEVHVRDLLRHRSGLPNYVDTDAFIADALADRDRVFTDAELLAYIADLPVGEPDHEYLYSQTNYLLLGQLIATLDGTDLATALADRITGPLGLASTQLAVAGAEPIDGLAGGWYPDVVDGDPAAPYDSIVSGAGPGGAIVSTASDLHTFLAALFGGELISDGALAEMTATEPDDYGLGLGYVELPSGAGLFGHDGEIFGYLAIMAIEPSSGNTVVVLVNNGELDPFALVEPVISNW